MATIGVKDLFAAKVIEGVDGVETFETPSRLAKLIKIGLSVEIAESVLYGDDSVDTVEKEFVKGVITVNPTDITNEKAAELLGQEIDADGVIYAGENDEPPYWAIGFRAKKPGQKYKYIWLYKVKFKIPNEEFETKGDGINFLTPTIEGEFIKLNKNGLWKADAVLPTSSPVAQAWFTGVKEKAVAEGQ